MTDRLRRAFAALFIGVVATALIGWLLGLDPEAVDSIVAVCAAAVGVGEASNIGKRATYSLKVAQFEQNSTGGEQ